MTDPKLAYETLTALARLLAPLVADELGRGAAQYSTASPATYPPACETRRRARDRIRAVPGHERIGTGRATLWSVSVEAYAAHHGRTPLRLVATSSDEEIADRALRGTRATRTA